MRIEGKKTETEYQIWQGDTLLRSIPLSDAASDQKLIRTIAQNKWEPL